MASLVSRFDTSRLLIMWIFKIPGVSITPIQSVGTEICDLPKGVMYTPGLATLCHGCICDSIAMYYPVWWYSCETHTAVKNNWEFAYSFLLLVNVRATYKLFLVFFSCLKNKPWPSVLNLWKLHLLPLLSTFLWIFKISTEFLSTNYIFA